MALNKLKKWIGTQAMSAFFDQLNDNVDAANAAIDFAEQTAAGNFRTLDRTDDPMSIADSMSSGEIQFFMTNTDSIEGEYGWGIIARRIDMRFVIAFTHSNNIFMNRRISANQSWSGWREK